MDEWMYDGWNEWMNGWMDMTQDLLLNKAGMQCYTEPFSFFKQAHKSFLFCNYVTLGIMVSKVSKVQGVNKVLFSIWSLRSSFGYLVKVWKPPTWTRTLKQSLAFPKLKTFNGVSHPRSTCRPRRIRYVCVSKENIVNLFNVWKQVWHHMLN